MYKVIVIGEEAKLSVKDLAVLVDMINHFSCNVFIGQEDAMINAKSFMGVVSLGLAKGKSVCVETTGYDEAEAMEAIERILV